MSVTNVVKSAGGCSTSNSLQVDLVVSHAMHVCV